MGCIDYAQLKKWTRILQLGACALVVAMGILKFIFLADITSPTYFIINVYLILLGILGIVAEIEYERILKYFHFLRFFFGKAFFNIL